ncbi:SusC/RagA family TonB-linked outer membrane protein [Sphingobacterium lactis]|uniref:SusC/RagA family TonB-linked outer membrane protein n=1 Tax=Sphingobacterium lactis TaxID=797291 RepID=UPI003DA1F5C9
MKQKLLLLFVAFVFLSSYAFGQSREITGRVTSAADSRPLAGVTVLVQGTNQGTQTNANGAFEITVPSADSRLVFSYVGYQNQVITVGSRAQINVELVSDDETLDEVVVTGYLVQSKKSFTGSSANVTGDKVANRPLQSFTQGLTGQASGVNVVQPSGVLNNPPVVRVRGLSSLSLNSFPLVVVDGIPVSTSDVSQNSAANNPLGDINPEDIESVNILKDAASTAIYGSRAGAGVLVITTKRGKSGDAKFGYDGWVGTSSAVRLPELLNAAQYIQHKNQAIANARAVNPGLPQGSYPSEGGFFETKDENGNVVDTRWYDYVYQNAISHNHNLNVSGGTEKTSYFFSGNVSDQQGILVNNKFMRRALRANVDHKITDWFKLGSSITYTNSENSSPNSGSVPGAAFNTSGLGRIAVVQAPNVSPYLPNGDYSVNGASIGKGANVLAPNYPNPLPIIDLDKNLSETNRLFANIHADINILKDLKFSSNYTWDLRNTNNEQFWNPINGDGLGYGGYAYNNSSKANNWIFMNNLVYNKRWNDHNFVVLVGHESQLTRIDDWGAVRTGLTDRYFNQFQGGYKNNLPGGNGISEHAFESYLSSINYDYAGKYYITGNFRRDGNSALAKKNRWGNFGGASIGWTISEENFFKDGGLGKVFSNMRFKASWGRVGNGNMPILYGAYNLYTSGVYGQDGYVFFNQAGNDDLKWESSSQTNVGVDFGLFDNRLTAEVNYYNKNIDNMILAVPQAPSKGVPGNSILMNVGSMFNRGFEFSLNYRAISNDNFTWNTNLNFATNKNEVVKLYEGRPIISTTATLETTSITQEGMSAAQIYAVRTAGVNPENGRRIFINKNGEQVQYQHLAPAGTPAYSYLDGRPAASIADQAVALGNTLPTWFGGFNNNFQYKNFDMALNFTFSGGNYIYNGSRAGLLDQRIWNNSTEVLEAWSETNKGGNIPRPIYGDNISNGSAFAIEENVEKGDFLRLQTATLGYRLPKNLIERAKFSNVRLYVSVNNAFLITKYTGVDPEISSNGNSNLASGVERNSIPNGRTFTFGVNIGL